MKTTEISEHLLRYLNKEDSADHLLRNIHSVEHKKKKKSGRGLNRYQLLTKLSESFSECKPRIEANYGLTRDCSEFLDRIRKAAKEAKLDKGMLPWNYRSETNTKDDCIFEIDNIYTANDVIMNMAYIFQQ